MPSWAEGFVLECGLLSLLGWFGLVAEEMSEVKCWIEACSLALEDSVTRIQRKCVNGGLGGMTASQLKESPCARDGVVAKSNSGG